MIELIVQPKLMTRAGDSTRDRLIETARQLFYELGYEATGVAQILEKAGVNSGSLYYLFRSKEGLLLEVLERYKELLFPVIVEPVFTRIEDPIERIFGILDTYRRILLDSQFERGCPLGNLGLELGDRLPEARQKIAQNFDGWCYWVERCLQDSTLPLAPEERKDLARFILTVMEGAVMQARVQRSIEPFDSSIRHLRRHLQQLEAHRQEENE